MSGSPRLELRQSCSINSSSRGGHPHNRHTLATECESNPLPKGGPPRPPWKLSEGGPNHINPKSLKFHIKPALVSLAWCTLFHTWAVIVLGPSIKTCIGLLQYLAFFMCFQYLWLPQNLCGADFQNQKLTAYPVVVFGICFINEYISI